MTPEEDAATTAGTGLVSVITTTSGPPRLSPKTPYDPVTGNSLETDNADWKVADGFINVRSGGRVIVWTKYEGGNRFHRFVCSATFTAPITATFAEVSNGVATRASTARVLPQDRPFAILYETSAQAYFDVRLALILTSDAPFKLWGCDATRL